MTDFDENSCGEHREARTDNPSFLGVMCWFRAIRPSSFYDGLFDDGRSVNLKCFAKKNARYMGNDRISNCVDQRLLKYKPQKET